MSEIGPSYGGAPPKANKVQRSFTVTKKLEIVKYAEDNNSINEAATKYGVDRKCIRDWKTDKDKLEKLQYLLILKSLLMH